MFNLRNASNGSSVLFRFILNTTGPLLAAIPKVCVLKVDGKVSTKHEPYKNGGKMFMTFTKVQPLASKDEEFERFSIARLRQTSGLNFPFTKNS